MVQQKQIIPENRYNEQRAYQNPPVVYIRYNIKLDRSLSKSCRWYSRLTFPLSLSDQSYLSCIHPFPSNLYNHSRNSQSSYSEPPYSITYIITPYFDVTGRKGIMKERTEYHHYEIFIWVVILEVNAFQIAVVPRIVIALFYGVVLHEPILVRIAGEVMS